MPKPRLCLQLPFKASKYDVAVEEPGLGEAYGARITLKATVSPSCTAASNLRDGL